MTSHATLMYRAEEEYVSERDCVEAGRDLAERGNNIPGLLYRYSCELLI